MSNLETQCLICVRFVVLLLLLLLNHFELGVCEWWGGRQAVGSGGGGACVCVC